MNLTCLIFIKDFDKREIGINSESISYINFCFHSCWSWKFCKLHAWVDTAWANTISSLISITILSKLNCKHYDTLKVIIGWYFIWRILNIYLKN